MNSIMETVCGVCISVQESTKQGISFRKLLNNIRKEFLNSGLEIKITTTKDKHLAEEVFYANGYYDAEDDKNGDCPIELIITHNFPKDTVWYPELSKNLLIQVFDTVVHELKHRRQYRKRNYKHGIGHTDTHRAYLSDPDEIDAYAISIAIELSRSLGRNRSLRFLHNIDLLSRFKLNENFVSPSLSMYKGELTEPNNKVIKKLVKKVYVRLQKLDADVVFM